MLLLSYAGFVYIPVFQGSIMLVRWGQRASAIQLESFDASDHCIRVLMAEEVHHFVGVLANELLGPVARCVMPTHPVTIPVIVDSQAGLYGHPGTLQQVLGIVRLWDKVVDKLGEETSVRPRVFSPPRSCFIGRMNPHTRSRPEPAIDVSWLQMGSVTAMEVAESSRCPD